MGHNLIRSGAIVLSKGLEPEPGYPGDAAGDLIYAGSDAIMLHRHQTEVLPTGVWAAIPDGHVGMVCSRSGLAARRSIAVLNSPGIIDPTFRGEIHVILHNHAFTDYIVSPGERIAQLLIMPTSNVIWLNNAEKFDALEPTDRAELGFGSTGTI